MCASHGKGLTLHFIDEKAKDFLVIFATKAHDMEMMITNHHSKLPSSYEFNRDKGDSKKSSNPPKASTKECMIISIGELMRISGKSGLEGNKASFYKETTKKRPTLKELQEKKNSFPDPDLSRMLVGLLENKIIKLPEPKWPK